MAAQGVNVNDNETNEQTFTSFASRRMLAEDGGIPFTMRLARVMFPQLKPDSLDFSVEGQFLHVASDKGREIVNKGAMNRNLRGETGRGGVRGGQGSEYAQKISMAYSKKYMTGVENPDAQGRIFRASDFFSKDEGQPSSPGVWKEVVGAVKKGDAEYYERLNKEYAALMGDSTFSLEDELIHIMRFEQFPLSRYNKYFERGSSLKKLMEGEGRAATRKLESTLKKESTKIIKTIVNMEKGNDRDTIRDGVVKDGKSYWTAAKDEITEGSDGMTWKMAIFEWEPMVEQTVLVGSTPVWVNDFPGQQYRESFLASRLNNLRFYVAVAYLRDSEGIQQYYAWAPDKVESLKSRWVEFHTAVQNDDLRSMERYRIESWDVTAGAGVNDTQSKDMLLKLEPVKYDIFKNYTPDSSMIQMILKKPLPIVPTNRNTITLDVQAMDSRSYDYLMFLPKPAGPGILPEIWASSMCSVPDVAARLGIDEDTYTAALQLDPTVLTRSPGNQRMAGLKTDVSGAQRQMQTIMSPMVRRGLGSVAEGGMNRKLDDLQKDITAVSKLKKLFEAKFAPGGNLYIQYVFGMALDNALRPELIESANTPKDVVLAYRIMAQTLLDGIAFCHSLGRQEALHIFHVDVINRLIKLAQVMDDSKTERVLKNVGYAVCVVHPVIGMTLTDKKNSFNSMSANTEILRQTLADNPGDCARYPGFKQGPLVAGVINAQMGPDNKTLAEKFTYWAYVLIDEQYFKQHTKGSPWDARLDLQSFEQFDKDKTMKENRKNKNKEVYDMFKRDKSRTEELEEYGRRLNKNKFALIGDPHTALTDTARQKRINTMTELDT